MLDDVIDGIATRLNEIYGDTCEINIDEGKQDFAAPSFWILCVKCINELVVSNRYYREYDFDIHYFPKSDDEESRTREIDKVADRLSMELEYISVAGDLTRGDDISCETHGGVLHFFISYKMFIEKALKKSEYMERLIQQQGIKE